MPSTPDLVKETLQAARRYKRAVAELARLTRAGADIEDATQNVVGAHLRYRKLLELWPIDGEHGRIGVSAAWTTLALMPTVLHCVHVAYNRSARTQRNLERSRTSIDLARQAATSSRSMSWRTVS